MTKRQIAYHLYLESEHWKALRAAALARDGHRCTRCPAVTRLEAHHTLYRARFEDSLVGDLVTLCRACHEKEHSKPKPVKHPYVSPEVAGSVGSRRWNSLGQRVKRNGRRIKFNKRKKPLTAKEQRIRNKYAGWAETAFRV